MTAPEPHITSVHITEKQTSSKGLVAPHFADERVLSLLVNGSGDERTGNGTATTAVKLDYLVAVGQHTDLLLDLLEAEEESIDRQLQRLERRLAEESIK